MSAQRVVDYLGTRRLGNETICPAFAKGPKLPSDPCRFASVMKSGLGIREEL